MSVEEQITQLIDKYEHETNKNQSEADLRAGYIDLLFLALGWNVYNDPQQSTNYRREGYIRGAGYVDVGLEVAGQPVLMLEAKTFGALPCSTERTYDRTPEEKQLFRYARGKRIPYCILTNFERFHVFNADHERLILAFDAPSSYLDRLSELLRLSPERVKGGSLPAWERQLEIKDIDEAFLTSLQDWRKLLANAIYKHNHTNPILETDGKFDFDKLMAAVQRILDRLILIRYADDKEVLLTYGVTEGMLSSYRKKGSYARPDDLMRELIDFSHRMDDHHNTTLFQPGHICEQVFVPNEVLEKVLTEINNISFRKFTSDILGNTYETYLGTKLAIKNGEIKSEERRDIRKAGGIFYTPPMIVRYIVDSTLGYLLKELEKAYGLCAIEKVKEIKVLDPACGSGSFLIYAYKVLADFYRRMNEAIENERVKLLASASSPDMFQRLELFKQLPVPLIDYPHHILENQLYGVDIDPEAAEIAAVNLTMQAFAEVRREKLPLILNENIKVGNSLISGTEEELRRYFGDNWRDKKRFNWEEEFKDIMANGGFDVVMGNPPYVAYYSRGSKEIEEEYKRYLVDTFGGEIGGSQNTFLQFIARGLHLLRKGGVISYIVPDTLMVNERYELLRRKLVTEAIPLRIVQSKFPVFPQFVRSCIFVIRNDQASDYTCSLSFAYSEEELNTNRFSEEFAMHPQDFLSNPACCFLPKLPILMQIKDTIPLSEICQVKDGINPGMSRFGLRDRLFLDREAGSNPKKLIEGKNICRYNLEWSGMWVDYDENLVTQEAKKGGASLRDEAIFTQPKKLVSRQTADRLILAFDDEQFYTTNSVHNTFLLSSSSYSLKFVLGILNSKFMSYVYRGLSGETRDVFPQVHISMLKKLPIHSIDFNNPAEKKMHDDLVALVDRMLELNKRLASIPNTACNEREPLLKEIEHTDAEIDEKVYKLYGLTKQERKTIESQSI